MDLHRLSVPQYVSKNVATWNSSDGMLRAGIFGNKTTMITFLSVEHLNINW